jgi:hypothetical protein
MRNNFSSSNEKEKYIQLFRSLIENYSSLKKEDSNQLLWKDFLLYFKKTFSHTLVGEMYTPKISLILRQLLNIDQELHVRKGIKLSFQEWLDLYFKKLV